MAARRTAAKPATIDIRGLMGREIAQMVLDGEIDQAAAERAVAERQVSKLRKEIAKLQA